MSTRANIIIKDGYSTLYFYRHSDGYPEGTLPTLEKFLNLVKEGKIRNNTAQAAGWLIILGAEEYKSRQVEYKERMKNGFEGEQDIVNKRFGDLIPAEPLNDWKVGAYEPTTGIHGDVEYIYTIDLDKMEITYKSV